MSRDIKKRKSELAHYENIEFQKSDLVSKFTKLSNELKSSSEAITKERFKAIKELETMINSYLKDLYMDRIDMDLNSLLMLCLLTFSRQANSGTGYCQVFSTRKILWRFK